MFLSNMLKLLNGSILNVFHVCHLDCLFIVWKRNVAAFVVLVPKFFPCVLPSLLKVPNNYQIEFCSTFC